ncbi:MAG TPA: DNA recombination protein RmuC [Candidatus Binataceae bacterium]|nr:DNA recombination protein RmuC [Candidatus Binataceae bacterium]
MTNSLLLIAIPLIALTILLQILALLRRRVSLDLSPFETTVQRMQQGYDRTERLVRDEISRNRDEASLSARQSRDELTATLRSVAEALGERVQNLTGSAEQRLDAVRHETRAHLLSLQEAGEKQAVRLREEASANAKLLREEVVGTLARLGDGITATTKLSADSNERKLESLRTALECKLKDIQEDNAKQLEQMRVVVDEKLQGTLERRLGESFKQVSDRLEAVSKGLGEMQVLATGVGDLKRVLANVKTRGTWGEVQLGAMLAEVLAPDQYAANVSTRQSGERVEFAIKLPGPGASDDTPLWLPIDAKFPLEDYVRLVESHERGDVEATATAGKLLETRMKQCAADIASKYLNPPLTTDFGILFLPTEGLFCEVIRRDGLPQHIQREFRVVIAGPTTLWAILNSLQMGFRTLAIQKRSSEVWNLLAAVKTEWGKYGDVLDKVQKKLHDATNTVEDAARRTRAIGRKLRGVEELPAHEADGVLMLAAYSSGLAGRPEQVQATGD